MKFVLLAVLIAAVIIAGCTEAAKENPEKEAEKPGLLSPGLQSSGLQSCGDKKELFSVLPADMEQVVTMTPVGMMTPPGHVFPAPHMYFFPFNDENPEDTEIPVYASADMVLKHIGLRHYNEIGEKENYVDYTLVFSPCKEFDLYFHHLRSLTYQPFSDAAERILRTCSFSAERNEDYCSGDVKIPIKAGVQFATAGDLKAGVWGFDLGARDYRIAEGRSGLLNPARHCSGNYRNVFDRCYTVCPFDYFTNDARSGLRFSNGKFGIQDLACGGNMSFDVKGSAQGYWFGEGAGDKWFGEEKNVYLGPNNLNPAVQVFSIGTAVPKVEARLYEFAPRKSGPVNRDFAEVASDGNVYCYDTAVEYQGHMKKSILIQLTSEQALRIGPYDGKECGTGPWEFGEYAEFVR